MRDLLIMTIGTFFGWCLAVARDRLTHKRLFDHRLRLEKEYELYCALWAAMHKLRRDVGALVMPLSTNQPDLDAAISSFNKYQDVVRTGEPFFPSRILKPARTACTLARDIIDNMKLLHTSRPAHSPHPVDKDPALREQRRSESEDAFRKFDRCYEDAKNQIRSRLMP